MKFFYTFDDLSALQRIISTKSIIQTITTKSYTDNNAKNEVGHIHEAGASQQIFGKRAVFENRFDRFEQHFGRFIKFPTFKKFTQQHQPIPIPKCYGKKLAWTIEHDRKDTKIEIDFEAVSDDFGKLQ